MKKVSKLPILFLAIFIFTKSSLAESNEVMLNINEKPVPLPAILEDNSILVPIRVISENLGFDVQWNNENKEIILLKNQDLLKLKVGSNVLKQNNESIILDQSPKIINNLTYLPVTFLDKLINYNLSPAENEKSINITTSEINNLNKKDYLGYEKTNEIEILRQAILKNKNLVDLNVKRKNCFFARFVREFSYLTYMDKVTYIVDKDDNVKSVDLGMAKEHFNKIKLTDNKAEEIVENLKLRDNSLSDLSKVKKYMTI